MRWAAVSTLSTSALWIGVASLWAAPVAAADLPCGPRPIPAPDCRIGRCVDGAWEQVCPRPPESLCGIKPLPPVGCRIGDCVEGRWEEICGDESWLPEPEPIPCGVKPLPPAGCRLGECVDGRWELDCT